MSQTWHSVGRFCSLLSLVLCAAPLLAASYNLELLGVPRFVNVNYIDLGKITQLTKFRSSAGHDYADGFETCRSMKHYFMAPDASTAVTAPVAGTVTNVFDEWSGTQVQITATQQDAFTFVIFHVNLRAPLRIGDSVTEGQLLGTHSGLETFSDIAVRVDTPTGMRLVPYSGCTSIPAYRQGQLQENMGVTVIGTPTDLTKYRGVVLYAGYGIGSTWVAACNNMLQSRSYAAIYTVQ